MTGLTEKQRRFVEAYAGPAKGNATEAARLAGYRGNDVTLAAVGSENLRKPPIAAALAELAARTRKSAIADVEECKSILSTIARNDLAEDKDRVAAIDKLLKSHGAYLEKRVVENVGATVTLYVPDNGRARA
jgi:phage terminase small subunit